MDILTPDNMWYVILPVIVLVTILMLRGTRRKLSDTAGSPQAYAREQLARLNDQKDMRGDMEQLLVQLQQLSRQINAQIDTKFAKLEVSIRAADERIARLQGLHSEATAPAPAGLDALVADDAPEPAHPSEEEPNQAALELDPQRKKIYELADAGTPSVDIAKATGQSTGEIELILQLRHQSGLCS